MIFLMKKNYVVRTSLTDRDIGDIGDEIATTASGDARSFDANKYTLAANVIVA